MIPSQVESESLLTLDMAQHEPKRPSDASIHPESRLTPLHSSTETSGRYDSNKTSGRIAVGGVCLSIVFSLFCIVIGIFIAAHKESIDQIILVPAVESPPPQFFKGVFIILRGESSSSKRELLGLALNVIVTICTESIGFVHATALKSALAGESRLRFNINLRLLTAARTGHSVNFNGTSLNIVMVILLVISYVSSSLVFLPFQPSPISFEPSATFVDPGRSSWILSTPVIVLGFSMLLQAVIALAGAYATNILTWSSSPFDITVALLDHDLVIRYPGRCMHGIVDTSDYGPRKPSERQPSAWQAHPSVKKVIIVLWSLVPACGIWGGIAFPVAKSVGALKNSAQQPQTDIGSWSFLPNSQTNELAFTIGGDQSFFSWIGVLASIAVIQGALTVGLHCSELIANVVRDEAMWRMATNKKGIEPSQNPLATVIGSWPNLGLLISKPVLHWMFGLSLNAQGDVNAFSGYVEVLLEVTLCMRPVQIWYLTMALLIFAIASTFVATHRPRGSQPAAYGHIQTLANLVDEWYPTMWWGHKEGNIPMCHAGTSDHPLPQVKLDLLYAG